MNIKPDDTTIKQLLLSGKQFIIPRFQREYSWEKKNYQEFIEDMTSCLSVKWNNILEPVFFRYYAFYRECFGRNNYRNICC